MTRSCFPEHSAFFNSHFVFNPNIEPTQISQLACFLFGSLATFPLQNDAARAVAGKNGMGHMNSCSSSEIEGKGRRHFRTATFEAQ